MPLSWDRYDNSLDGIAFESNTESLGHGTILSVRRKNKDVDEKTSEIVDPKTLQEVSLVLKSEGATVTKIPRPSFGNHNYAIVTLSRDRGGDYKSSRIDSTSARPISFRKRKSLSLMEITRHRQTVSRPPKHALQQRQESDHNLGLATSSRGDSGCYDRATLQLRNNFYCFVSDTEEAEVDSKLAGMRVFASIMLNAWRRRRDEVRRLNEELGRIKKGSVKTKNQIHVISSLFKVEQKTNDDLSCRLRRCLEDQQKLQDMYNDLNKAFSSLQVRFSVLEDEKAKEVEGLNYLLGESKTNLFKSMSRERELETNLTNEQRKLLELENEKNELLSTIVQLEQSVSVKMEVENALTCKCKEVDCLKSQLDGLEKKLKDLKEKEKQVREYQQLEMMQRKSIEELTERISLLDAEVKNTIFTRTREWLQQVGKSSSEFSHLILHCLLPMTPPPPHSQITLIAPKALEKAIHYCWS